MSADRPPRFDSVHRIFCGAGDLAGADREAYLQRECAGDADLEQEVRALLAEEEAGDPRLDRPAVHLLEGRAALPERIGDFRILAELGHGGMGLVYEAEQASPRRHVALKVIASPFVTEEQRRRFQHEGRALAWLNHPGIATVYATGTADTGLGPRPWLAMELVRGERLDVWAVRSGRGTAARLALLVRLCEAVQHAHEKGVIHRDLKPGNVLVDAEGQPKVLDFGVALLTDADLDATRHTGAGELLGTLPYMSPEQVRGDPSQVDVRSDVYALGVIAYELLGGKRPHEVSSRELPEAIHTIVHDEPTSLGLVARELRGDVETIVHKAMAKERERRYGSVAELAADIRRHLASEPILARPASRAYTLRKFARRNRALVGGLVAVFAVLTIGATTSTVLYFQKEEQRREVAERGAELEVALSEAEDNLVRAQAAETTAHEEEDRAHVEARTAEAVTEYLVTLFEYANPESAAPEDVTALDLLERGVERIGDEFAEQPEIKVRLLNVFGKIYNWLQRYELSRPILEEALALMEEAGQADSAAYADTLERIAIGALEKGRPREAEEMFRRVLDLRERHLGKDTPLYTDALNNLGNCLSVQGDLPGAEALVAEARDRRRAIGEPDYRLAQVDYNLACLYLEDGRVEAAVAGFESALAGLRAYYGDDHWRTLYGESGLCDALRDVGDHAGALEHGRRAMEGFQRLFGADSLLTARARKMYALALADSGRRDEAIDILEELRARHLEAHGEDLEYAYLLALLASTLHDAGHREDAEVLYLDALDLNERLGRPDPREHRTERNNLAVLYRDEQRWDEAEAILVPLLAEREQAAGLAHPDAGGTVNTLCDVYVATDRVEEALALQQRRLAAVREEWGEDHWRTQGVREHVAELLRSAGGADEAAAELGPARSR